MSTGVSWILDEVMLRIKSVCAELVKHPVLGSLMDTVLPIPHPFLGTGPLRLVIIGQDPTVQNLAEIG